MKTTANIGDLRPPKSDLVGQKFGYLTVTSYAGGGTWNCLCKCGRKTLNRTGSLTSGNSKSCGCLIKDVLRLRNQRHGFTKVPEFSVWRAMITRCTKPYAANYKYYGGRGIRVCDRWLGSFQLFLSDMGSRPSPSFTLERINNDGNYEPSNCCWATRAAQYKNRRGARLIDFDGLSLTATEWGKRMGISEACLRYRLKAGWEISSALSLPSLRKKEVK